MKNICTMTKAIEAITIFGAVDPSLLATQKGISTVKSSFIVLLATALIQVAAVSYTGSIALLADMIHHFGDAATSILLWIARRRRNVLQENKSQDNMLILRCIHVVSKLIRSRPECGLES